MYAIIMYTIDNIRMYAIITYTIDFQYSITEHNKNLSKYIKTKIKLYPM